MEVAENEKKQLQQELEAFALPKKKKKCPMPMSAENIVTMKDSKEAVLDRIPNEIHSLLGQTGMCLWFSLVSIGISF